MSITDAEERELKVALMQGDLVLKQKQGFWETPKGVAAVVAATAVIVGALAGVLGFKLGQAPAAAPPQIIFQPGAIQLQPAPPPKV